MIRKDAKIYVAGHRGLVGSAILNNLRQKGYSNFVTRTHQELDLTDQRAVADFFATEKPEYVFLAAAKVGGIEDNRQFPADFMYQNMYFWLLRKLEESGRILFIAGNLFMRIS